MNPGLLRRRQLVLREAGRFPDLARKYHESGPRQHDQRFDDRIRPAGRPW